MPSATIISTRFIEAYVVDAEVRAFLEDKNPNAAREIAERLAEALDRGLWQPRSNAGA